MIRKGSEATRASIGNYQVRNAARAENTVKAALVALGLVIRGSYTPGEVCLILGISERGFWRLCKQYEVDDEGRLARPDCLRTLLLGTHRRVSFLELVDFIRRNDEYLRTTLERNQNGAEDRAATRESDAHGT